VREVSERIAVSDAVGPVLELTSGKGFKYEDVLDACVARIAAAHGDLAEKVATQTGVAGTHKGDEVVTLNQDDTHGVEARFALEAKTTKLNLRKTLEELEAALENRGANAAVAVFSSQDQAPTTVPFQYIGNKAIAVLDKEGLDDAALRLAYMWSRWVVRRALAGGTGEEFDLDRVAELIEDARRAIERVTTIKRCHTQASKAITQAGAQVTSLVNEVDEALVALANELAEPENGE
jgi:hypothetical protein